MFKSIFFLATVIGAIFTADANGMCPDKDRYCVSCGVDANNANVCMGCAYSYVSTNGQCMPPTTTISGCITYSNATTCAACDEGHYLSGNTCKEIPVDNCDHLASDSVTTVCAVCDDGYKNDPATGKCTETSCGISNCKSCTVTTVGTTTSTTCVECNSGYALNDSYACVTPVTANCQSQTGTTCQSCARGYYDSGTTCSESDLYDSAYALTAGLLSSLLVLLF